MPRPFQLSHPGRDTYTGGACWDTTTRVDAASDTGRGCPSRGSAVGTAPGPAHGGDNV